MHLSHLKVFCIFKAKHFSIRYFETMYLSLAILNIIYNSSKQKLCMNEIYLSIERTRLETPNISTISNFKNYWITLILILNIVLCILGGARVAYIMC